MVPEPDPTPPEADDDTILLRDLAPRREVKGGAGKILFGEQPLEERPSPPPDPPSPEP